MKVQRRADLLTRAEAAAYIGVSTSWLGKHRGEGGDGPTRTQIGGKLYYLQGDLDEYINNSGGNKWASSSATDRDTGSTNSSTADGPLGGRLARSTSDRLRERLDAYKQRSNPPSLRLVDPATE